MLKLIKTLLRDKTVYISIAITILITALSLFKVQRIPISDVSNLDKIQHTLAYFVLTVSWFISRDIKFKATTDGIILICCFAFGIIIEVLQGSITTYRTASFLDVIANSLGILIGFVLFKVFVKKK
jgi:VanZ family protein